MKSAAEYPEYQGDPDNIQFLTRNEHLAAHKGSWQNPTNWYYNPETKEFIDFGENKPIPCEAINLSEPVCSPVIDSQNEKRRIKREVHESFGDKVLRAVDAVREFSERYPILTGIVKWGGIAAAAITTAAVANNSSGGGRSSGDGGSDYSSSESFDDYSADDDDDDDYADSSNSRDYPDERSSPREHDVSGYDRQQNGKTVHVNPYKRGGRHDDD